MKRVLTFLAIMLLPLSVMAMTPVADSDLADVTGQAGVNINADLTMNIAIGTMAWGDSNGLETNFGDGAGTDGAGYIGITNLNITNLRIRARETDNYGSIGYASGTHAGYYEAEDLKPITIDVATGGAHPGVTFVRFGLGSLQISLDSLRFGVFLGTNPATFGADATSQKLGDVYISAIGMYINPISYVDIFNARGVGLAGVTMDLYVVIDRLSIPVISWGDSDGLTLAQAAGSNFWIATSADPGAGFVGLYDLNFGEIIIDGLVNIDVSSVSNGKYMLPTQYHVSDMGKAVVHIGFGSATENFLFRINGPITSQVRLAGVETLDGASSSVLGDFYVSGLAVEILGGSWVDIWAH